MKKQLLSKYSPSLVLLIILTGLLSVIPSCGGGGSGSGPAPIPTPPQTTASPAKGIYAVAQSVTLTSNRSATIYYSLNGNMPSIGGADTISGPSPITNIQISSDTNLLQFFAVDSSGSQEAVKSETYVINTGATTGPGDAQNYFPLAQGNTWATKVTVTETGYPTVTYSNSISVTGTKVINGATAVVMTESNPDNTGIAEEDYNLKSSHGVLFLSNNNPSDLISSQIVPYYIYNYSPQPGSSFVAVNNTGLDYGEDVDYDGKNETASMSATVTFKGFESISVPVGTHSNCAKVEINLLIAVTLSSSNETISVVGTETDWFAPGIGPVKSVIVTTSENYTSTETEELTGYYINGQGKGIMPQFTVVSVVAVSNSDTETPGKSGVGFDGTNYLVVSCRDIDKPAWLYGVTVSGSGVGSILNTFPIVQLSYQGCSFPRPAVAFDGNNYLVVFQKNGQIIGTRVSPSGTVLDGPDGFVISTSGASNWAPVVSFDGTNYLVAWMNYMDIYGAIISTGGQSSGEFPISVASGSVGNGSPAIAFDGNNYMVVWTDNRGTDGDIYGARVTKTGIILDLAGIPISTAPYNQTDPSIAFDGTNYFIVWNDQRNPQNYLNIDIYGARLKTDGTLLDGPSSTGGIAINTSPNNTYYASVTFDGANYFVVWSIPNYTVNDAHSGIYGARVSMNGNLIGGPSTGIGISISGLPPAYSYSKYVYPYVLFNGESSLLVWTNNSESQVTAKSVEGIFIYPY